MNAKVEKAQGTVRLLQQEVRFLTDLKAKLAYQKKIKEHQGTLQQLSNTLALASSQMNRSLLLGETRKDPKKGSADTTESLRDTRDMTQQALHLQQDAKLRLDQSSKAIEETISVGTDTQFKLKGQGERLRRVRDKLDETEGNVVDANRNLRRLLRSLLFDRCVLFLLFLILVTIVLIFAIPAIQKQTNNGASPPQQPPNNTTPQPTS